MRRAHTPEPVRSTGSPQSTPRKQPSLASLGSHGLGLTTLGGDDAFSRSSSSRSIVSNATSMPRSHSSSSTIPQRPFKASTPSYSPYSSFQGNQSTASLVSSSTLTSYDSRLVAATIGSMESGRSGADTLSADDVWSTICVRVLPLFNGEGQKGYLEDLNEHVSLHIRRIIDKSPAKVIATLSTDFSSLVSIGMLTLNSKLSNLNDEKFLTRIIEVWTFFFAGILPALQGIFLPFSIDPQIRQISQKAARDAERAKTPSSTTTRRHKLQEEIIDVRRLSLISFRDHIILPVIDRLGHLFTQIYADGAGFQFQARHQRTRSSPDPNKLGNPNSSHSYIHGRRLQMVSILASVLTNDEHQASIDTLLRCMTRTEDERRASGSSIDTAKGLQDFTAPIQDPLIVPRPIRKDSRASYRSGSDFDSQTDEEEHQRRAATRFDVTGLAQADKEYLKALSSPPNVSPDNENND